jgi:hypothetical protein
MRYLGSFGQQSVQIVFRLIEAPQHIITNLKAQSFLHIYYQGRND